VKIWFLVHLLRQRAEDFAASGYCVPNNGDGLACAPEEFGYDYSGVTPHRAGGRTSNYQIDQLVQRTSGKQKGAMPTEADLFNAACSLKRFGEPLLDPVADGWLTYCVRDAIAVSHEAGLAAVMNEVTLGSENPESGIESSAVVEELIARAEEHDAPMRDLKLLGSGESVLDLSFRDFYTRVEKLLQPDQVPQTFFDRGPTRYQLRHQK